MGYKWKLWNKTPKGVDSARSKCLLLFYLPLFSPWNLGLMAGAPVAILAHEVIIKMKATHKGWRNGQEDSFWVSDACGATIPA